MDTDDSSPDVPPLTPVRAAAGVTPVGPGGGPEAHGSTPTRQGYQADQPTSKANKLRTVLGGGPPPGLTRPEFWRSPLRGPWLTSVFGLVLLIGIPLMFVPGLLS